MGDFFQDTFCQVAGGYADGVQRLLRIEIHNVCEVLPVEICLRFQSTTAQQHESDAFLYKVPVEHLNIQAIQFFQIAIFRIALQLLQIIHEIILYCIPGRFHQGGSTSFPLHAAELVR